MEFFPRRNKLSSQSSAATTACPICTEEFVVSSVASASRSQPVALPCCGKQVICRNCLYRHIVSILQEAVTGQGRSDLHCPLGCGAPMPDNLIRQTIAQANPMVHPSICRLMFRLYTYLLQLLQKLEDHLHLPNTSLYYEVWLYWNHSRNARRVLQQYERWNLVVGLRSLAAAPPSNQHPTNATSQPPKEVVIHCPAPDCGYAWTASEAYRRHKQAHEQRPVYLWYAPPNVEQVGDYSWVEPQHLHLCSQPYRVVQNSIITTSNSEYIEDERVDGRRMVCAKCQLVFCGLCRLPWQSESNGFRHRIRRSHRCLSCVTYHRTLGYMGDRDFALAARITNSRCCPGCSVRTVRSAGCNHMTCPCGYEWCYVCERRWKVFHYSCEDRVRHHHPDGEDGLACTIS